MTEKEKDFEPTQLDQQIEQSARYLDAQANRLVEDLQRLYHTSNSTSSADRESLQRVRSLLAARLQPAHQETKIATPVQLSTHHKGKFKMIETTGLTNNRNRDQKDKMNQNKAGWQRFSHTVNIIAAVLVVALLIGSIVAVIAIRKDAQNANATRVGSSHTTTKPLPNLDCPLVAPSDLDPDNGEHAVCAQGLETALQGTTTLNGHTVTLISAYADANRLLVKYAVSGNDIVAARYSGIPFISDLSVQSGSLTTQDAWTFGGGTYYDRAKNQTVFVAPFPTSTVSANTTQLQVNATFMAVGGANSADPAGTSFPQYTFTFTVPFHTEKRVATPNQSVVINGYQVTLSQVTVTASATTLFLKTDTIQMTSQPITAIPSATVNGNKNVNVAFTTNGIVISKWGPVTGFSLGVPEDWMAQPTAWNLSLQSTGVPLGVGSGTIQFTVPR